MFVLCGRPEGKVNGKTIAVSRIMGQVANLPIVTRQVGNLPHDLGRPILPNELGLRHIFRQTYRLKPGLQPFFQPWHPADATAPAAGLRAAPGQPPFPACQAALRLEPPPTVPDP